VATLRDQPLKTLAIAVTALGVVSGLVASFSAVAEGEGWYFLFKTSAYWTIWALLIPVAVTMAMGIRRRQWGWPLALCAHATAGVLCAGLHLAGLYAIDFVLHFALWDLFMTWQDVARNLSGSTRLLIEWELTMYAALAAFAYATSLETSLAEARLLSLQRQLQPHFLFNTLHAISALIRRDPDTAEAMIERLARLLRTSLRTGAASEVSVAQDLAALRDYLAIEAVQMRERLHVSFDLEDEAMGAAVPAMLLQPLVENSVRHGLQPRDRGGSIHVSVKRASDDLCLEVVDDGVGLQADGSRGIGVGLANTRSRLAQLYGVRQSFSLTVLDAGGVRVRITLPFRTK
jgi:two-component system LytT family sensor kinase